MMNFNQLVTPFHDILLQAVVLRSARVKSTDIVAGGVLRNETHQGIFQDYMHIHMGDFSFNECPKVSRISDELQQVSRSSDDPVKKVPVTLKEQLKQTAYKTVKGLS